jgi:hypothetical protein
MTHSETEAYLSCDSQKSVKTCFEYLLSQLKTNSNLGEWRTPTWDSLGFYEVGSIRASRGWPRSSQLAGGRDIAPVGGWSRKFPPKE